MSNPLPPQDLGAVMKQYISMNMPNNTITRHTFFFFILPAVINSTVMLRCVAIQTTLIPRAVVERPQCTHSHSHSLHCHTVAKCDPCQISIVRVWIQELPGLLVYQSGCFTQAAHQQIVHSYQGSGLQRYGHF